MKGRKLTGLAMAAAVVGLLAAGYGVAADQTQPAKDKKVKCAGINECKGHGACAAADGSHDCSGKNSCKGKGWIKVETEQECTDKGGTVVKEKKEKKGDE